MLSTSRHRILRPHEHALAIAWAIMRAASHQRAGCLILRGRIALRTGRQVKGHG